MSGVTSVILASLCGRYPEELVTHALDRYDTAKRAMIVDDWHKVQSHVGLFCEAVIRICRNELTGVYTAIGDSKFKVENEANACLQHPASGDDKEPFRYMIPTVVKAAYAVRSRRGVDHLAQIQPNHNDARLQMSQADWMLSELIRCAATTRSFQHAQAVVDSIMVRELPLLEKINGEWKILAPNMPLEDMILLVKYNDDEAKQADLVKICRKSQPTVSRAIDRLDEQAFLHKNGRSITITTLGRKRVEGLPRLRAIAS
jgi:hypothetical protein